MVVCAVICEFGSCSKLASQQTIPERRLVSSVPKSSRRERNFSMQRPEAKNPPERPLFVGRDRERGKWAAGIPQKRPISDRPRFF
jgi:hypothetical protein